MAGNIAYAALFTCLMCGCSKADKDSIPEPEVVIPAIPPGESKHFGLTNYYEKYRALVAGTDSIPIVSAAIVSDEALARVEAVCKVVTSTLPKNSVAELRRQRVYLAVFGNTFYPDVLPGWPVGLDAKRYAGGFGPSPTYRACGVHEGDALRNSHDRYRTENIVVHEFGHAVKNMALEVMDGTFKKQIQQLYDKAIAAGKWTNTYAGSNPDEYWAECLQSYFDVNAPGPVGGDGIHNDIWNRERLKTYDPEIFALLDALYGGATLPPGEW
ncbi:hypothetical protein MKQ68_15345 [Chitinophaga horti]|uniref:Uncharacterized protein n=1 Tax=Chitinophaga horti TaxID=2920382 RepID=A0ABY6IVR3_9BACT|nr:hypothetical protein [Chitinophaga horti]UYQ91467.1 hypothetical protein MKQ68_15345 [Chitinophaga horti]